MNVVEQLDWVKQQVVDLQSQFAFQEDTIQSLNDIVTRQQRQIEDLNELINNQKSQLERLGNDADSGPSLEKPPHY